MSQHDTARIGGVGAVAGGILIVAGNALHPREPGQLDDAETLLDVAAGSQSWVVVHVVILLGITLLLVGFYGLTNSIADSGDSVARLAWAMAIVGATGGIAFMLLEIVAVPAVAETWAASTGAETLPAMAAGDAVFQISLALSSAAPFFLFGIAPALCGVAMFRIERFPRWVGLAGILFGSLAVAATLLHLLTGGTTVTGLVLVPIGIVGTTLWMVYIGVAMLRTPRSAT